MKIGDTYIFTGKEPKKIIHNVGTHKTYSFIEPSTTYVISNIQNLYTLRSKGQKEETVISFKKIKGDFNIKEFFLNVDKNYFLKGCMTYYLNISDKIQLVDDEVILMEDFEELSEYRNNRLNEIIT